VLILTDSCGYIGSGAKRKTLTATYTPTTSGLYSIEVYNYRNSAPTTCIYNYTDDIRMEPQNSDISMFPEVVSAATGGQIFVTLEPGASYAGENYFMLISRGSTPGFMRDGVQVNLNIDDLFLLSRNLANGGIFQNTIGTIDAQGFGSPRINIPANLDPQYVGLSIFVAGVHTTAPGTGQVTYAYMPAMFDIIP